MTFLINGRVLPYLIKSSILCITCAFISSILGEKFFILFLMSFCLLPIFIYMFRENNNNLIFQVRCLSPCDGVVQSIKETKNGTEIIFQSNLFDTYQKKSPINGKITNITYFDSKHYENPMGVLFELENNDGKFIIEVFHNSSIKTEIDVFVSKNNNINQGDNICFVEFGSKLKLVVPSELDILINKNTNVINGISCISI